MGSAVDLERPGWLRSGSVSPAAAAASPSPRRTRACRRSARSRRPPGRPTRSARTSSSSARSSAASGELLADRGAVLGVVLALSSALRPSGSGYFSSSRSWITSSRRIERGSCAGPAPAPFGIRLYRWRSEASLRRAFSPALASKMSMICTVGRFSSSVPRIARMPSDHCPAIRWPAMYSCSGWPSAAGGTAANWRRLLSSSRIWPLACSESEALAKIRAIASVPSPRAFRLVTAGLSEGTSPEGGCSASESSGLRPVVAETAPPSCSSCASAVCATSCSDCARSGLGLDLCDCRLLGLRRRGERRWRPVARPPSTLPWPRRTSASSASCGP